LLEALLEGLFLNGVQLRRRILYDVLTAIKNGVFNLGNSQKSQGAVSGE
jgi:hypothetical protein